MQSLRSRLTAVIILLCAATLAAGGLMVGLFYQSASAQAGEAEAQIARACDAVAATYRFYSTDWQGPGSLQDSGLRAGLTAVVQTALRDRPSIEGGVWQASVGSLAYAYPTYQGAQAKTDFPQAELSRIQAINASARSADRATNRRYTASSQVLLLTACPLTGPIPGLTAWTMTRVVTFAGRAYQQLMAGLGVLLAAVVVAATLLIRVTLNWSRHVARVERTLQTSDVMRLPQIDATGEKELDQIIVALNLAGRRLADTAERTEDLARRVAGGERLAAIGRIAAGVAHEIRNPIAAMRLKAESALAGDSARKDEALTMIVGQIARLDRLLKRLLSLTERDPPQRRLTPVGELLANSIRAHAELALAKDLELVAHAEVQTAFIDGDQIGRALDNLLLNAIDAAPTHSTVLLSARRDAETLVIGVHDDGPGPPPAIRDQLFEPFVTGRPEGTGLGLSLVREIANAHGGAARLADSPTGTSFEILVPWRDA
jgi:signal transduction histidine kinase